MKQPASYRFPDWFLHSWSRAGLPLGIVLLLLAPLLLNTMSIAVFLTFLLLPIYMMHQYEEHARGRFKAFVNGMLAHGQEKITDVPIFWVNIIGVWGLDLAALYGAAVHPALGLIAAYATVVNGLLHVLMAIRLRRYNPGLWTSIVLLLPIGGYSLYAISQSSGAALIDHALGFGVAVILHVVTIIYLLRYANSG